TNPSGDLADIIKALQNLCDYSITNKFGDGKSYRVNYLTSEPKELIENLTFESEGFTHELKFYL
ncbi:MAG: hypothetical protein NZM09_08625, partial [Ignavibacterium sp.]|nr:hypothetical protein [Ignavibacterium sp.]MDW8375747.1 hypothetical protein [Ignavibacteriales bacterium]